MLQGAPKSRLRQDVDKAVWIRPLASASGVDLGVGFKMIN